VELDDHIARINLSSDPLAKHDLLRRPQRAFIVSPVEPVIYRDRIDRLNRCLIGEPFATIHHFVGLIGKVSFTFRAA
jgi:hypothetical protein